MMLLETTDRDVWILYDCRWVEVQPDPAPIDFHEAMREYFSQEGNVRLKLTQEVA